MFKKILLALLKVAKTTFAGFLDHGVMTYAASIAFYTIFSLPGLLIITITSAGLFLGQDAARGELVNQLQGLIGTASAETVENIITKIQLSGELTFKTVIGLATLIFSATTIFISLQEALNRIWDVVATPEKGIIKFIINRVLSFGMIVSLGLILLITLLLDSMLALFFDKLENTIGRTTSVLVDVSSTVTAIAAIFVIIVLVFKTLPDVKLQWKNVITSALITTGLLSIGNYLISWYISNSNFTDTYSAAGSVIVILVWVYYSTIMLLFGAEIARAITIYNDEPIRPADNAKKISVQEMDYETYQKSLTKSDNNSQGI